MPSPKQLREQLLKLTIDQVKGFFKAGSGFDIDLTNRLQERVERFLQIFILKIQILLPFRLHFVFFDSRKIDRTQSLNSVFQAL